MELPDRSGEPALQLFSISHTGLATPLDIRQGDDVSSFEDAFRFARSRDPNETPYLGIARRHVLLNTGFADELRAAITDPGLFEVRWLSLISDGLDISGRFVDQGNFLDDPVMPSAAPLRVAAWGDPAIVVIDVARLRELDDRVGSVTTFNELLAAGNQAALATFISSRLRFSFPGERSSYRGTDPEAPDPPSAAKRAEWLRSVRPDPSIAVAVRTTASRPGLLRRNIVALSEAHEGSAASELLIVSSDDRLDAAAAEATRDVNGIPLKTVHVPDDGTPSRVAAMAAALSTATSEYVWFVDDDDWVTSNGLAIVRSALHAADRPIVVAASNAFRETWTDETLSESVLDRHYYPGEWYRAFTGWNFLPVCSVVMPRELALERLSVSPLLRDLGEDYAMQLLLFTAPGSTVAVADETIANVSVRTGADNVVTMTDRVPWFRDLASHASDLSRDPMASTQAFWALGRAIRDLPYPTEPPPESDAPEPDPSGGLPGDTTQRARQRLGRLWKRIKARETGI